MGVVGRGQESFCKIENLKTGMLLELDVAVAGNERLGDFTPAFLWLLRDFYLRLEEEGGRKVRKMGGGGGCDEAWWGLMGGKTEGRKVEGRPGEWEG